MCYENKSITCIVRYVEKLYVPVLLNIRRNWEKFQQEFDLYIALSISDKKILQINKNEKKHETLIKVEFQDIKKVLLWKIINFSRLQKRISQAESKILTLLDKCFYMCDKNDHSYKKNYNKKFRIF